MRLMTQEQRDVVIAQIKKQHLQARMNAMMNANNNNNVNAMNLAHGQHQDMGNNGGGGGGGANMFSGNVPGPGLGNYGGMGMMNTMGVAQGQAPSAGMMGAGQPRSASGGGMVRNPDVSYEMMKSFMQRNQGGAGMGNGMGGPV